MTIKFSTPKISFIVTCYNKALYLKECLLSIKEQSYLNREIVVVDDCSSDESVSVVEKFMAENPDVDVKFVQNKKNSGQLASFLNGVKVADGEFVTLTDGDDVLFSDFAAAHIKTHLNTTVALTSARQIEIDENGVVHSMKSSDCPFLSLKNFSENVNSRPRCFRRILRRKILRLRFWTAANIRLLLGIGRRRVQQLSESRFVIIFCT